MSEELKKASQLSSPEASIAVAKRFIAALNAGDGDAVRQIYASDAKIWHNFDGAYQSVADNIRTLGWMHKKLSNIEYDIIRLEAINGGYLQQHILRGTLANGELFELPAIAVCMVENDQIVSLEEYLDIAQTAKLNS